ncbi:MAG: electron transfer flavoprotein subunit alpha/FixB family protein [Verrucomicrobia bacterium]|nr:electron transfer flavoprotein subunit alpha/FixB family protein [Verrucomicrobiota bacterium]
MRKTLVLIEHTQGQLRQTSLHALGAASELAAVEGGTTEALVMGHGVGAVVDALRSLGCARIWAVDHPQLADLTADRCADVIAQTVKATEPSFVLAAASTFSKDLLPRAAALLDAGMISDVVGLKKEGDETVFKRVQFAGNVISTVQLSGALKFLTIRPSAFPMANRNATQSEVQDFPWQPAANVTWTQVVSREERVEGRPDATEARIVVSGGRAFKNSEDFERVVGGLADALGAAVGSSRALVDAGITPNSLQIGQTGKVVAPELYIALGISGAIQHMAGMKDSKVIVAVNKDPDAPVFEAADYGLVADVYETIPEWTRRIKGS